MCVCDDSTRGARTGARPPNDASHTHTYTYTYFKVPITFAKCSQDTFVPLALMGPPHTGHVTRQHTPVTPIGGPSTPQRVCDRVRRASLHNETNRVQTESGSAKKSCHIRGRGRWQSSGRAPGGWRTARQARSRCLVRVRIRGTGARQGLGYRPRVS